MSPSEEATYRKVTWRLLPLLFLCYVLAYLDRVNVGFAKLQMQKDLGFSDTVYGIGAGVFFIGYFLFEVPSNLILERVGARIWIARIMILWGMLSSATMFVTGERTFYALRFALGVAEPLYEEATVRGGAVSVQPDRVVLEQPTFPAKSGPLWRGEESPNGLLREVIAWDKALGQVVVTERESRLFCAQGAVERTTPGALFVACAGDGPRLTGFRVTKDTRVLPREVGGVEKLQPGREVSVRAAATDIATTREPPMPRERIMVDSKVRRPDSPTKTVAPEKNTAFPAVATVTTVARSTSPRESSSRKRLTMKRE